MKTAILAALLSLLPFPAPAADYRACHQALRADAAARGVTAQTFDMALAGFEPQVQIWDGTPDAGPR